LTVAVRQRVTPTKVTGQPPFAFGARFLAGAAKPAVSLAYKVTFRKAERMVADSMVGFVSLYVEYWRFVFDLLPIYGVFGLDQDDVARTVWKNIDAQIARYDPKRQSQRAWIAGLVRQCATNYRRNGLAENLTAEPGTAVADSGLTPEQWLILSEIRRVIPDEAVRETFLLRFRHDLTIEEIAAAAGVSKSQIGWWLQLAVRAFRGKVKR
jgi:DNA-directed RNA polymerase specialized sigma24 family protein